MSFEEELTAEQQEKFEKFKQAIADIRPPDIDDHYILRFLIARRYDLAKAEDMIRKHERFMKLHGLDRILTDYTPLKKTNYFYTTFLGYDNEGCLVRLLRIGASDLRGLVYSQKKMDSIRFAAHIVGNDRVKQQEHYKEFGVGGKDKQVYILDLEGLSWRYTVCRPVIERTFMLLRVYEANYPESLKTAYITNAPVFFSLIFNWLKNILPADIVNKIEVLSSDECGPVLKRTMDPSILPAFLGGTRTDPDGNPYCNSLFAVTPGTPVPESFYLTSEMEILNKDPEAKRVTILNRSTFTIEMNVAIPHSILQWDFQTSENDIGMGLFYKGENGAEPKEIIPIRRYDCYMMTESGRYDCADLGTYELVFDNTYSWLSKKELTYKVSVTMPTEDLDFN